MQNRSCLHGAIATVESDSVHVENPGGRTIRIELLDCEDTISVGFTKVILMLVTAPAVGYPMLIFASCTREPMLLS